MKAAAAPLDPRRPAARRTRTILTPEGLALRFTLASRGVRAGALVIDLLAQMLLLIGLQLVLSAIARDLFGQKLALTSANQAMELLYILYVIASFVLINGWFLFFELGPRGATPGKRLVGIRVAARDGGRLSAEKVLARNLVRDIEFVAPIALFALLLPGGAWVASLAALGWVLIFPCLPLWNRDRLRAGDIIGGTWVVEAPRRRLGTLLSAAPRADAPTSAGYRFGEAELAIYGEYELQTLERVLRDGQGEAMAAVAAAICGKIGWHPPGSEEVRGFLTDYYTQLRARLEAGMRLGTRKLDKFSAAALGDYTELP